MGKKSKSKSDGRNAAKVEANENVTKQSSILTSDVPLDPLLSSLFEKSAGPVQAPSVQYTELTSTTRSSKPKIARTTLEDAIDGESDSEQQSGSEDEVDNGNDSDDEMQDTTSLSPDVRTSRKRKRGAVDNLEDVYMQKIAREEQKEEAKRRADQSKKREAEESDDASNGSLEDDASSDDDDENSPPPVHEALSGELEVAELDKASRTVFLANVSNSAIKSKSAKKTLLKHLSSFLPSLPKSDTPHKVESIRFRSTAYGSKLGVPRRAAFAHKDVMDSTASSTNAYVVFSTKIAAQKAPGALNGTVVLDRHLRVDSVAHPSAIDNKRCVFVGNLDFVDQENDDDKDDEQPKKKKPTTPADVEEGLWRTFNAHTGAGGQKNAGGGNVESVRVVRDQATRVGKGFAYVQFYDSTCVEAALLLDGKKFPPLLPRKLRVVRAKKINKKRDSDRRSGGREAGARDTLSGRAKKLFGRAGAAKVRNGDGSMFIFEGKRAVEGEGQLKVRTKSRGASKKNRSSRRAAAYRASGGRRSKTLAK